MSETMGLGGTFRKQYRELTDAEKMQIEDLKTLAEKLEALVTVARENGKNPRQLALAMTKLEESVMWATKAITG